MKKALLGVLAVAIIGLAAANLNLALKGESFIVNMSLAGTETLAQGESQIYHGKCKTELETYFVGNFMFMFFECADGGGDVCEDGLTVYEFWGSEEFLYYDDAIEKFCISN